MIVGFTDLETITGEPKTDRVSGVLIGSANTQHMRVHYYWISLEHDHLVLCFNTDLEFSGEQDSLHS